MNVYAVKHRDENVVVESRSGGIFTALSDLYLSDGVVYGCVLDDNLNAVHIRATNSIDRDKMRGSKYVQSSMNECFKQIKNDLDSNQKVLFSGTTCQVAGLKKYLKKEYDSLLCVDIVCHGVPSPIIWQSYLQYNGNVSAADFRNKKDHGWREHIETLQIGNEKKDSKVFTSLFYSGIILRPSCYECPLKNINHPGDITIGDYWGIEKAAPEFDDNKGTSLVLVNTEKGKKAFEEVSASILYKETTIENAMQRAFIRPEYRPDSRDKFWKEYKTKGFNYIVKKYSCEQSWYRKYLAKAKSVVRKIVK